MNIFITGINGFIGKQLAEFLSSDQSNRITGSVSGRHQQKTYPIIDLNENFDSAIFQNIDLIIHCAYDLGPDSLKKNIDGTKLIMKKAQEMGVKRQIFISSYSAHSKAESQYGTSKYMIENYCREKNYIIVRPGLVMGHGGLFLKLSNIVEKFIIVPVIGRGQVKFPVILINDLVNSIRSIAYNELSGTEFNLFYPEQVTLMELLKTIAKSKKLKRLFVPIPLVFIYVGLWIANIVKLELPITLENLKGYTQNTYSGHVSHLKQDQKSCSKSYLA